MKHISIIICLALFSCHDVKVGYLETEAAQIKILALFRNYL